MPKNPLKSFGRRKSSGNVLDDVAAAPASESPTTSSFRVLERPNSNIQHKFGADADARYSKPSPSRPFNSPLDNLRFGKSADELGLRSNPWAGEGKNNAKAGTLSKQDRASAGTTNSGSSGYYDSSTASARRSSSSTIPSSVDDHRERESDELFAQRKVASPPMPEAQAEPATNNGVINAATPTTNASSFRSRAARAFSFGGAKQNRSESQPDIPPLPSLPLHNARQRSPERAAPTPHRERAPTTSSYASTAVPVKKDSPTAVPNLQLATSSFGDDFGYIFANFGGTKPSDNSLQAPSPTSGPMFHRAESSPMMLPRALSRQTPSPRPIVSRHDSSSPYSFDDTDPHEALMNGSALESPGFEERPNHNTGIARAYLAGARGQYGAVQEQTSPRLYGLNRTPTDDSIDQSRPSNGYAKPRTNGKVSQDEDEDSWVRKVSLRHREHDNPPAPPAHTSPQGPAGARASFGSRDATPQATKVAMQEESLFDSSPNGPPSRAIRPAHSSRPQMPAIKKMTRAEFERLQKGGDASREDSEEEDDGQAEEEEDEDEVEIERAKQAARQRRKQEANMAVYRQQMKKVTGGGPADLPSAIRPSLDRAANSAPASPSIHLGGMGGAPPADALRGKATDDDDDDVPLGILQAHGFPSAGRPPTRLAESDLANQRRTSVAGSVVGGGAGQGHLPAFARRLPADPYFGASVVNQPHRESLAFGSNGGSVYGGAGAVPQQAQAGHPAGLVGVIVGEERARAARRGSPNPTTGTYTSSGATGLPSNMGLPRTMSMGNITPAGMYPSNGMPQMPMMPMPGMQQMPMMPPDASQQQMHQFMQMQMQFMQSMMAMQQQAMVPPPQQDMGPGARIGHRPSSSMSSHAPGNLAMPNTGRAMTMMGPPGGWDAQGLNRPASSYMGGYTPSVHGMNLNGGGPGPGYTPSIAPSERSNIGMPSRYRPVNTGNGEQGKGRTHSMTSSMTLQAFQNQQGGINGTRPQSRQEPPATIRVIDKPKGSPKIGTRVADDDEEEGWAEMTKKRTAKKFSWRKKDSAKEEQQALSELYQGVD